MRSRARAYALPVIAASLGLLFVAWLGLTSFEWSDYDSEARPAIDALLSGHVAQFFQIAPAYGGSLVIRAPFILATKLWGAGALAHYRAAAFPCLLAVALLGVWLCARMRELRRPSGAGALVLALCVVNPVTLPTLDYGHPEELLGGALCVAAVLVAMRGKPVWSGVLLGLAIANKQWAIVAAGPVLLALPGRRVLSLLIAGAIAGAIHVPFMLAGGAAGAPTAGADSGVIFHPWALWWFLGAYGHAGAGFVANIRPGFRGAPTWILPIAHPLIVAITLPLTLGCVWLRRTGRRRPSSEALLLLVLVLFLRCVLDPWDNSYYPLPFLLALLAWEALTFDRLPVIALGASFATWIVFQGPTSPNLHLVPDAAALLFLAFVIPGLAVNLMALYTPERLSAAVRRRAALASPA